VRKTKFDYLQLDSVPREILRYGLQVRIGAVHRAAPAGAGGGAGGGGGAGAGRGEEQEEGDGQGHAHPLVQHSRTGKNSQFTQL
jgi:hypothetical protein